MFRPDETAENNSYRVCWIRVPNTKTSRRAHQSQRKAPRTLCLSTCQLFFIILAFLLTAVDPFWKINFSRSRTVTTILSRESQEWINERTNRNISNASGHYFIFDWEKHTRNFVEVPNQGQNQWKKITKITYFRRLTEELQNMIRETYTIPNTKKKVYDRMTGSLQARTSWFKFEESGNQPGQSN